MIRPATFSDIPVVFALIQEMHGASIYRERAPLNEKVTKALLLQSLQRQGSPHQGGTMLLVAESDGAVVGFILGILDRLYGICDGLMATDLLFFCSDKAPVHAAMKLLRGLMSWAEANVKVVEVRLGATDAVGDHHRTAALFRRAGMEHKGVIYEKAVR